MLERVYSLDKIRETERKEAAKVLQKDYCAFVANYGHAGKEVEVENLTLEEMESLREFMVERINQDIQYQEDEIDRYIDLYL